MTVTISTVYCIVVIFTVVNTTNLIFYTAGKYRITLPPDGWIFDAAFGIECILNAGVGILTAIRVRKVVASETFIPKATINALGGFVLWFSLSSAFCYICSLFLARYQAKHGKVDEYRAKMPDLTEDQLRSQILYFLTAAYTATAAIKFGLLYVLFDFYKTAKQQEGDMEQPVAYYFAAGASGVARGQPIMASDFVIPAQGALPVVGPATRMPQPGTVAISYLHLQVPQQQAARHPAAPRP